MKKFLALLIACFIGLAASAAFADSNVTFIWDANSEMDLAGYTLYQRSEGQVTYNYDNPVATISAGTEIVTVNGIIDGTYFWVLRAFDKDDNYSGDSNEVTARLDTTPPGEPSGLIITVIVKIELP